MINNCDNTKSCLSDFGVEWVLVEITNICNMNCEFCPSSHIRRQRKHMDFAQYKTIIDQLAQLKIQNPITLHVIGEPLLNPEIYKFIDYANTKNIRIFLYTNCSNINKHISEICQKTNIEALILSLQTPDEHSYLLRQYNKQFSDYMEDIYSAINYILTTNCNEKMRIEVHIATSKYIPDFLSWSILDTDEKISESIVEISTKIKQFANQNYVKININENIDPKDHYLQKIKDHPNGTVWSVEVVRNVFIRLMYLDSFGLHESLLPQNVTVRENSNPHMSCNMLKSHLSILVDGTITTCPFDVEGELVLGNINKISLLATLQSEKRNSLIHNSSSFKICRRCQGVMELNLNAY